MRSAHAGFDLAILQSQMPYRTGVAIPVRTFLIQAPGAIPKMELLQSAVLIEG
jgi:hypothetical protein